MCDKSSHLPRYSLLYNFLGRVNSFQVNHLGTDGEVFDLGLDTNDVLREWLYAENEVKKYESLKSIRSLLKHLAGLNDGPLMFS